VRGHIREWRKPGTYKIWIEHPKVDGKRQRETFVFRGSKKDAEAKMAERIAAVERGDGSHLDRSTVAEVAEKWLAARKGSVGAKTLDGYEEVVRDYIKPAFGTLQLRKLIPLHIESALAKWRLAGARERKLSPRTLHRVYATLNSMLKQAVRWNIIARNPCDAVTAPSRGRAEIAALDEKNAIALLDGLPGTSLSGPVHLALLTGLRRGELLGLQWPDVDFVQRVAHVRRSVEQLERHVFAFKDTKTLKSRRAVPLTAEAIDLLTAHRAQQNALRLKSNGAYNPDDLVFPNPATGLVWDLGKFSEAFRRAARIAGVNVTFHGLRHTFATIALRARVPMRLVSDILGHSTTALTADIYTHVLEDMQREAAERVAEAIAHARRKAG
jgi:integrase